MDPDEAWSQAVAAAEKWTQIMDAYDEEGGSLDNEHEQAAVMAESLLALRDWFAKGGAVMTAIAGEVA